MKPGSDSDFKPVTFWPVLGTLTGIISEGFPQGEGLPLPKGWNECQLPPPGQTKPPTASFSGH
jgi:hypothetical protein